MHVAAAEESKEWVQHASWQMPPDVLAMVRLTEGVAANYDTPTSAAVALYKQVPIFA